MPIGAPVGNQNARRGRLFREALIRRIAKLSDEGSQGGLDKLADELLRHALAGESWAFLEVINRLDGKCAQSVTIGGDEDAGPVLIQRIERVIVDAATQNRDG